ncbi:MAG: cysteine--tRNA ligase [Deltaproteobacteria bacterium]|nr:cysteine--tRNA ligase [Deltaproteobacteria bacterium]
MGLKLFNTLSGRKEELVPVHPGEVRMYVCGVTVYDSCHVGHARSLLTFDVVYRYLQFLGYRVTFVRNFTDVDDKIIQRAKEQGTTANAIAGKFIAEFYRDAKALRLVSPSCEPKATEHIPEIIALIRRLEAKGIAYPVDGDVFFSVDKFPSYGKLSGRRLDELEAGARVEVDERKKSPLDFALWKAAKEGEPSWDSPWGAGRPGWHIECSAMSTKYLGQPFDIHAGGRDLIFPHHENEIAQSEAASELPFARYWIHNELLQINQQKMSKSLGNFYTIQEILERCDAAALRHYFLASHYRSPLDFSEQGLEEAARGVERIYETAARLSRQVPSPASTEPDPALLENFREEMSDDFNTPRALALVFEEVRALNRLLDQGKTAGLNARGEAFKIITGVLGLQGDPEAFFNNKKDRWLRQRGLSSEAIEASIQRRNQARRDKRWEEADHIRTELHDLGIILEDTPGGTVWKVK